MAASTLSVVLTFVASLALAITLHVNLPPARRALLRGVHRALSDYFVGDLRIEGIEHSSLFRTQLKRMTLSSPNGNTLLTLDGVRVRYSPTDLLLPLLDSSGQTPLTIEHVHIRRATASAALDPDTGRLLLATALSPRNPPPHPTPPPFGFELSTLELDELVLTGQHPKVGQWAARATKSEASFYLPRSGPASIRVPPFGLSLDLDKTQRAVGLFEFRANSLEALHASFHGLVDDVEVDAEATHSPERVEVRLDAPAIHPRFIRRWLPDWSTSEPARASLRASGTLSDLAVHARITSTLVQLKASGSASAVEPLRLELDTELNCIALEGLWSPSPPGHLTANARASVTQEENTVSAHLSGRTSSFELSGYVLDGTDFSVWNDPDGWSARLESPELGGTISAQLMTPIDEPVTARVVASTSRLSALPFEPSLQGSARLELNGERRGRSWSASATATGHDLAGPSWTLSSARLQAETLAPWNEGTSPRLSVRINGRDLRWETARVRDFEARARGSWEQGDIHLDLTDDRQRSAALTGTVDWARHAPRLRDASLAIDSPEVQLRASIEQLSAQNLQLSRLRISGEAGELQASLALTPERVAARLRATQLELGRLARMVTNRAPAAKATVTGEFILDSSPNLGTKGRLKLEASDAELRELALGELALDAQLRDGAFSGRLSTTKPLLAPMGLRFAGQLAGDPRRLDTWEKATGGLHAEVSKLPLWLMRPMLPSGFALQNLEGEATLGVSLERPTPGAFPDLFANLETTGLQVHLADEDLEHAVGKWENLDLRASANIDGVDGRTNLALILRDARGPLLSSNALLSLPPPRELVEQSSAIRTIEECPLEAHIRIHARALSELPHGLPLEGLDGVLSSSLTARGSLRSPQLFWKTWIRKLQSAETSGTGPLDLTTVARYSQASGLLEGDASLVHADAPIASARFSAPRGKAPGEARSLRAGAIVKGLPLALLPALGARGLRGRLHGGVEFRSDPSGDSHHRANLRATDLTSQGRPLGTGNVEARGDDFETHLEATLGSAERQLRATANATHRGLTALLDGEWLNAAGTVEARDFDAASLQPLTSGWLSRINGSLDSVLRFEWQGGAPSERSVTLEGSASIQRGRAHIDSLGLELRDFTLEMASRVSNGITEVTTTLHEAKAQSSEPNVQGSVTLQFEQGRASRGSGQLSLDEVPLGLEGLSHGKATGEFRASLERRAGDVLQIELEVPRLVVQLPESSTRSLIDTAPNPDLRVLQRPPSRERRPGAGQHWQIDFDLGPSVRLRRADLDIPIRGRPSLTFHTRAEPRGNIEAVPGGRFDLFDHTFIIERGNVGFDPTQPDNPSLDLTASWRAPEGTLIFVDVTGTAKQAQIRTRDDGGLSDAERLELLTGGSPLGEADSASSQGPTAAAIGQAVARLGINQILKRSLGDVAVKVAPSTNNRATYTAAIRLGDRLWFEGNFQPGTEQNEGSDPNTFSGTLDYRFSRRWSVRTELGTSGGAFDLLWSHRY